jgi:hypothetical protein
MKVIEVQPTPNPNAMKFVLDGTISEKPLSFFNPEAGKDHALAKELFAIPGVAGLLLLKDFVTVSKTPKAVWKEVTPAVKRLLMRASAAK